MTVNTLGSHEQYRSSRTVAEWLWPFLPMGIAAFSLSAVFWYHKHRETIEVRAPLQHLYAGVYRAFGLAPSVLFFLLVLIWGTIWLVTGKLERPFARLGRLGAMLLMLGIFLNLGDGGVAPAPNKGALGAWFAENLVGTFGYIPSLIVVWAITFASLLLATDFFFHDAFERLRQRPPVRAPDAGVEVAVTDHLRGLASVTAPPEPAPAPAAIGADAYLGASAMLEAEAEPRDRRSYFERRAEREGRAGVPFAAGNEAEHEAAEALELEADAAPLEPAEPPAAVLAFDDAVVAEPEPAAAPEAPRPGDVYETPEAIDAAETPSLAPGYEQEESVAEPWVAIPRPDPAPAPPVIAEALPAEVVPEPDPVLTPEAEPRQKQQRLFGGGLDDGLVQDAIDVVVGSRRASAAFLQRKLRIDYALAVDLLAELAARGVVAIEGDATQGRVLG